MGEGGVGSKRVQHGDIVELELGNVAAKFHAFSNEKDLVTIDRKSFALAKGGLFLVANLAGKLEVKQLPLSKLNLQPSGTNSPGQISADYLRTLATTDTDISAFWKAGVKK